jgi:hypothetical protein
MSADKTAPTASASHETVQKEPRPPPPSKRLRSAKTKRPSRGLEEETPVRRKDRPRRKPEVSSKDTLRAGARRLTAFFGKTTVVPFKPSRDIRLARTARACGKRTLGAEMQSFTRLKRGDRVRKIVDVEKGADSVRAALAKQLGAMGWKVLQEGGLSVRTTRDGTKKLLARFAFKGEVAFFVEGAGAARKATVAGKVQVLNDRGQELHESEVSASAESSTGRITRRTELARRGALAAFVKRFFGDAKLDGRLAAAVKAALRRERGR